jgi:predicted nucleotidyltransferase
MKIDAEPLSYGLQPHVIAGINAVFAGFPDIERVILYGSRAKGNYRPYKIDLALHHHIDNPDLLSHIDRVGTVFYQKENP